MPQVAPNGQGQWPWYWESDKYRNRWNNNPLLNDDPSAGRVVKTIYDPSPRGYAVPPGRAFEQFLTSGMSDMLYSDLSYWNAQIRSQAEYIKEYGARFRVRRGDKIGKPFSYPPPDSQTYIDGKTSNHLRFTILL